VKEGGVMSQATVEIVRVFAQVVAAGITLDVAEPAALDQTLRDCARSAAFIESVRLRAIARLDQHVMVDTNQTIITTSHGSKRQAQTAQKRADAAARMPTLANLRHKWLRCRLRALHASPHQLLAKRWSYRHRQSPASV
jgi:hypothetical protein